MGMGHRWGTGGEYRLRVQQSENRKKRVRRTQERHLELFGGSYEPRKEKRLNG